MLQLKPQNIIPITKARGQLDDLVSQAKGSNFYAISRRGETNTALIDLNYVLDLQSRLETLEMKSLNTKLHEGFKKYLKDQKIDPDSISETEVDNLLTELVYGQTDSH